MKTDSGKKEKKTPQKWFKLYVLNSYVIGADL